MKTTANKAKTPARYLLLGWFGDSGITVNGKEERIKSFFVFS
jgi:hypothetical protein